jgi:hypothetical protein
MEVPLVLLTLVWELLRNFWWMFVPMAVAWMPDGQHVKWTVAVGFAFYGALAAYAFLGDTDCGGACGVELLSIPAWLLSSTIYLIIGLHRWVKASEVEHRRDA